MERISFDFRPNTSHVGVALLGESRCNLVFVQKALDAHDDTGSARQPITARIE